LRNIKKPPLFFPPKTSYQKYTAHPQFGRAESFLDYLPFRYYPVRFKGYDLSFLQHPRRFYVHTFCFELTKQKVVIVMTTPQRAALPLTAGVFLCGALFRSTPILRAPHSPFLQKQKFLQIGCAGAKV